ncbi:MAG: glycosyltransferase family 4 protein [Acidimicrobiales bacterium]
MKHLLVTNDFPPKIGGIQYYLWELWRRLPPDDVTVLTAGHPEAAAWDARQGFRVERTPEKVLFPTRSLARRIGRLATRAGAELVLLDPALPLGVLGRRLERPYGVVVHGAEVTVPGRLPGPNRLLRSVLNGAKVVIAAGGYPAAEAERVARRSLPIVVVPPGVDTRRFVPLTPAERAATRAEFGLPVRGHVVLGVSRLVPRKGFDVLIEAAARRSADHTDLVVAIAGHGRDRDRLDRLIARTGAPVRMLGRVPPDRLPALYGAADAFAMLCRDRWGGLEQEGFGIVFLEAAATGVPQVAGASGGAAEAVVDGETGFVVRRPDDPQEVARVVGRLLDDDVLRLRLGVQARRRAESYFDYDVLARRLALGIASIAGDGGGDHS